MSENEYFECEKCGEKTSMEWSDGNLCNACWNKLTLELELRPEPSGKDDLLNHYCTGDVHEFIQYDGWYIFGSGETDPLSDQDGDSIFYSETEELRHSPSSLAVRVHIHKGTTFNDAYRLLSKIAKLMKIREFVSKEGAI